MARKCPDCGYMNDDGMPFCARCGEPIDPKTRLVMALEHDQEAHAHDNHRPQSTNTKPTTTARRRDDDDDDDITPIGSLKEKKSPVGLILALVAVAAVVYFLFLK